MKSKKLILPISIVFGIVILFVASVLIFGAVISEKGYGISSGTIYFSSNGTYLINSENSAMRVSDRSNDKKLFDGYENGDKVILFHDGIEEVYPARTSGYYLFRLSKGDGTYKPDNEVLGIYEFPIIKE